MKKQLFGLSLIIFLTSLFILFNKNRHEISKVTPIQEVSVINESMILQKKLSGHYQDKFSGDFLDQIKKGISLKNEKDLNEGIKELNKYIATLNKQENINEKHLIVLGRLSHSILLLKEIGQIKVVLELSKTLLSNKYVEYLEKNPAITNNLEIGSNIIYFGLFTNKDSIIDKGRLLVKSSLENNKQLSTNDITILIPLMLNYPQIRNPKIIKEIYTFFNSSNLENMKEYKFMFGVIMNDKELMSENK